MWSNHALWDPGNIERWWLGHDHDHQQGNVYRCRCCLTRRTGQTTPPWPACPTSWFPPSPWTQETRYIRINCRRLLPIPVPLKTPVKQSLWSSWWSPTGSRLAIILPALHRPVPSRPSLPPRLSLAHCHGASSQVGGQRFPNVEFSWLLMLVVFDTASCWCLYILSLECPSLALEHPSLSVRWEKNICKTLTKFYVVLWKWDFNSTIDQGWVRRPSHLLLFQTFHPRYWHLGRLLQVRCDHIREEIQGF